MLCNEMSRARVQGAGEEGGEDKIYEWLCAEVGDEEVVKEQLGEDIEKV